jgi:hypothetical protein
MGSSMRLSWVCLPLMLLAGCMNAIPQPATTPPPRRPATGHVPPPARPAPPPPAAFRAPQVQQSAGLESVIQQNAASLVRQFGPPRLDVHEGDMRKLQFTGEACVLDVFLYPLAQGAEPVATYAEARRSSDGQDVDKSACVQALLRR